MMAIKTMETMMIEIPSQTDFHSMKKSDTRLESNDVNPMANQRTLLTVYQIDSQMLAAGAYGRKFSPNLKQIQTFG